MDKPVLGLPGWDTRAGYVRELVLDVSHFGVHPGDAIC